VSASCCVYAIVGRDMLLPSRSIEGNDADLAIVPWGELAAVTGPGGRDRSQPTMENVLHHEAVVEAVRQHGRALPVRFGTVFRDATSVASALADRYERLRSDLHRLGDKIELSLTALWVAPERVTCEETAKAGVARGARYLLGRAAELRRQDALKEQARLVAEELDQVLGGRARDRRVSLLPTPRIAVRTAYLMDAAGVRDFRAAFDAVRGGRRDVCLLLTGPWSPYSFVQQTEAESGAVPDGRLAELAHILTERMRGRLG
jgi:hypothetical protein